MGNDYFSNPQKGDYSREDDYSRANGYSITYGNYRIYSILRLLFSAPTLLILASHRLKTSSFLGNLSF